MSTVQKVFCIWNKKEQKYRSDWKGKITWARLHNAVQSLGNPSDRKNFEFHEVILTCSKVVEPKA